MEPLNDTQKAFTLLNGGVEYEAKKLDGSTEKVCIRILRVKEYAKVADALSDELKLVEVYCDKLPGWAENLHPESHEFIVSKGEAINQGFFGPWLQRRIAMIEKMSGKNIVETVTALNSPSSNTSPNSPRRPV